MREKTARFVIRVVAIAPLLVLLFASALFVKSLARGPTAVTLTELRAGKVKNGEQIELSGGGLCALHILNNAPEGSDQPQSWFVAYVDEGDLPELQASAPRYPLDRLALVRFTPAEFRSRYPKPVGPGQIYLPEDFTCVLHTYRSVPATQWFGLAKDYGMPPSSLLFLEPGESPADRDRPLALMILSAFFAIPGTIWFVTTFAPPLPPRRSANEHLIEQDTTEPDSP